MICGGVFNDLMATYVLRHKKQVLARNRKLVMSNLQIYQEWIANEERASVVMPQAVSTSFPKLDVPVDIHQFCEQLLADQGVLLVPGDAFDTPGHVRLGYCAPQATLKEGLKRLSTALHQYDWLTTLFSFKRLYFSLISAVLKNKAISMWYTKDHWQGQRGWLLLNCKWLQSRFYFESSSGLEKNGDFFKRFTEEIRKKFVKFKSHFFNIF